VSVFSPFPKWVTPQTRAIAGYAAIFGQRDKGGDLIYYHAFDNTLAGRTKIILCNQHNRHRAIGAILRAYTDPTGLYIEAALGPKAPELECGTGLSFGYRVRTATSNGAERDLVELELIEISVVKSPMQPTANVKRVGVVADFIPEIGQSNTLAEIA
jgi:uncharacterized protein